MTKLQDILPLVPRTLVKSLDDSTAVTECLSPASTIESPVVHRKCVKGKVRCRRRVKFSNDVVDDNSSVIELSEEEFENLWFTKEEFQLMRRSTAFIVRMMASGSLTDDDDDEEMCTRGLESNPRAGNRRKRQNIENSIDAVLIEQQKQWAKGYSSTSAIANVYKQSSCHCSMASYVSAQRDAQEVNKLNQN